MTVDQAGTSTPRWSTRQRVVAATAAAVLVLGLAVTAAIPAGRHQLLVSFTHRPEVYTELYLAPQGPVARTRGTTTQVRFGIRSHEARTTQFPYQVLLFGEGRSASADGTVTLLVGEKQNLEVAVTTGRVRWERLEIRLLGRPERLTWVRTASNEVTEQ